MPDSYQHVEELITDLARPTMVMRFALGAIDRPGAKKRYVAAGQQIETIVHNWSKRYGIQDSESA